MKSLVIELQQDALDSSIETSNLLRKALVVARKLKVNDLIEWLNHELNGYPEGVDVPKYRKLRGELKAHNPYNGWIPLMLEDPKQAEALATRGTSQAISELEDITKESGGLIYVHLPKSIENSLMRNMEFPFPPAVILSQNQVRGILDRVRNTVLDWALELESKGITGEGMSFSSDEQDKAHNITFNIENVGNFIGSMSQSQLQSGTNNSKQSYEAPSDFSEIIRIIRQIEFNLNKQEISKDDEQQIKSNIACIEMQIQSPRPSNAIIKETLHSTRAILEGLASSAVFQAIITSINKVM